MIGRLRGTLVSKHAPWIVLEVGGVGYELEVPMSTYYDLPAIGEALTLVTHYAVREDAVALYGFATEAERRLFRDVQKVSGIGAKIALAVLSGSGVDEFAHMLQAGDIAALTKIPGIGKKTAERMIVELRERSQAMVSAPGAGSRGGMPADAVTEAGIALQQLGYKPAEVSRMLKDAQPKDSAEDLIRMALKTAFRG
ncbi:Holliday junction branch migration protein RuvA [Arenimonas sp. GDDSR-1]|uniref:Holliday junction branch migration protein RuvA n=1 Tax=Arenimonas sp. GDDSR-1 TaxID=2950125 RepID=UPI0026281AD6|nr:Holliday junction branch migration protein RuvA [Arenimonas sp. GDDSR-1]